MSVSLQDHNRFPFASINSRIPYAWPGEKSLAVYIAVNLEHFSFGSGLGAKLAPSGEPDVLNYSWREYGNRVGAWRLLDVLVDLGLPVTLLVNSEIYNHCPELPAAYCEQLHNVGVKCEIVGHGCSNAEKQSDMDETTEKLYIETATSTLAKHSGEKPKGWLGPWISESHVTPDLLQEAGYTYTLDWCHDDQPVWMTTRGGGKILSIPYSQEINDIPAIVARHESHTAFADMIVDHFDEMLSQACRACPLVLGIALHPYIVGQPFRLRQLRRALNHIEFETRGDRRYSKLDSDARRREEPDGPVWLTTAGEIYKHVASLPESTVSGS